MTIRKGHKMKPTTSRTFGIIVATLGLIMSPVIFTLAQTGSWVEYALDGYPGVSSRISAGNGCAVYTRQQSDRIIIFDIRIGEWQVFELAEPQYFEGVKSEGEVVFAYSDSVLFAYSSPLNTWDTMTYHSDIVFPCDSCAGCGKNMAYLMADSMLYVFDVNLGYWQTYDYGGYVEGYYTCYPWVKDNYLAFAINRGASMPYKNIVYSHLTNGFNELDTGLFRPYPLMDYGFCGFLDKSETGGDYLMIGYSAQTNAFSRQTFTSDWYNHATFNLSRERADLFTAGIHAFTYVNVDNDKETVLFGYDTRRGVWDRMDYTFDYLVETFSSAPMQGGQLGYDVSRFDTDNDLHFFIYDGTTGQFRDFDPGIEYRSTTAYFTAGGTAFMAHDSLSAWGYDVRDNRSSLIYPALHKTANFTVRENFGTLTRWSPGVDTMVIYFYNSDNNSWSNVSFPDHHTADAVLATNFYLFSAGPENKALFYASAADAIIEADFPDDASYLGFMMRGDLAHIRSENMSVLVDGNTGSGYTFNYLFDQSGLGMKSAVFCDQTSGVCQGYSTITESFAPINVEGEHFLVKDTGYIGLAIYDYHTTIKFYTYNGMTGSWVLLQPDGDYQARDLGMKTAIVVSSNAVYAFNPESDPTGLTDDDKGEFLPEKAQIHQNYPNPFNPSTVISYSLPHRSHVTISIYNLLGQRVKTLVETEQAAGDYSVRWDGTGEDGSEVSTGIYFYQITTDDLRTGRKMLLLK